MTEINKVIELFKNQSELAGKMGVTKAAISNWKKRGVPLNRALEIEKLTSGQIKASDLRSEFMGAIQ